MEFLPPFLLFVLLVSDSRAASDLLPKVDCQLEDFENVLDQGGFGLRFASANENEKNYQCICADEQCSRVNCNQVIVLSARSTSFRNSKGNPQDHCFDEVQNRLVGRGAHFTRQGNPVQGCECPETGEAVLKCEDLTCKYDIAPTDLLHAPQGEGHCTNPWTQQEHADQDVFNHTMVVNKYQKLTNTLKCTCNEGMVMCKLLDHLCCDEKTGELKVIGEKFHKSHPEHKWILCGCEAVEMQCRTIPTPPPTSSPLLKPISVKFGKRPPRKCRNRKTGKIMEAGESYVVIKDHGQRYLECKCKKRRNKYKLKCKPKRGQ